MLQHLYERNFIGYSYLTAIVDPYLYWSPYLNNLAHLCWENENIKMCCSENAPTLWVLTDREFRRDRVLTRAVPRTAITVTLQHLTLLAVVVMIMMMTMIMIIIMMMTMIMIIIMMMTMMINEQSMSFCHTALDIIVGGFGDYLSTFSNNIWHFDRQMMIRMGGTTFDCQTILFHRYHHHCHDTAVEHIFSFFTLSIGHFATLTNAVQAVATKWLVFQIF